MPLAFTFVRDKWAQQPPSNILLRVPVVSDVVFDDSKYPPPSKKLKSEVVAEGSWLVKYLAVGLLNTDAPSTSTTRRKTARKQFRDRRPANVLKTLPRGLHARFSVLDVQSGDQLGSIVSTSSCSGLFYFCDVRIAQTGKLLLRADAEWAPGTASEDAPAIASCEQLITVRADASWSAWKEALALLLPDDLRAEARKQQQRRGRERRALAKQQRDAEAKRRRDARESRSSDEGADVYTREDDSDDDITASEEAKAAPVGGESEVAADEATEGADRSSHSIGRKRTPVSHSMRRLKRRKTGSEEGLPPSELLKMEAGDTNSLFSLRALWAEMSDITRTELRVLPAKALKR
eukprot:PLAT11207.1.p1 GENE.PLAT11207.1~~PLAT11207.1.p1  ORF type:complete len:349 (+),score=61.75 PLAT11207.1:1220-2266(+)